MEREWRRRGADTAPPQGQRALLRRRSPRRSATSGWADISTRSRARLTLPRRRRSPLAGRGTEPGKAAPKEDLAKATIKQAVGAGVTGKAADVEVVKKLLSAAGYDDPNLEVAIQRFQRVVVGLEPAKADGRVDPNGTTFKTLKAAATTPGGVSTDGRTKKDFWADDDWENLLPKGDAGLHFKRKGAYDVEDTDKDKPKLDDKQKAVLAKINANRTALPDLFEAKHKGRAGYSLGDSRPAGENATPTAVTKEADADRKKMKALIWDELGTEAALEGVQTYDDQGWGWGKGWSAKGSMTGVMSNLFALDPAAEKMLFEAGIALSVAGGGTFKMVNGDTGAIEYGQNAIELMRVSPKLLSIFVTLGRDAAHKQHATDAQWQEMEKKAGKVPAYAYKWLASNDDTVRLIVHMSHWQPAYGWEMERLLRHGRGHVQGPQAVLPARRHAAAERRLGVPGEPRSRRVRQAPRPLREGEGQDRSVQQREDHHGEPGADGGQARRRAAARPGPARRAPRPRRPSRSPRSPTRNPSRRTCRVTC